MSSVSVIEGARFRAVIDDMLEKLSFLSIVTPDVLGHGDEMAALVGDEISATIREQRVLEARFEDLVKQVAAMKGVANKAKVGEVQAKLKAVSTQMRDSMRGLCRSLKDNPDVGDNLAKLAEERDALVELLTTTSDEVAESGHYHTLAEHVHTEGAARERVSAIAQREAATTLEVTTLTSTLRDEEEQHAVDMEAKRAELALLKDRLRKLKQDSTVTIRYVRKEITSKTETTGRVYSSEEAATAEAIEKVKAQLAAEATAHELSLELLKRETDEYTRLAESWRARHAAEVAAKGAELKALTAERDAQKALLDKLQARYEKDLAVMTEKEAEAERVAAERAVSNDKAAAERRAATALVKILGPMFMTILAQRQLAAAEKNKAKKK
jgi:hypothetical protein